MTAESMGHESAFPYLGPAVAILQITRMGYTSKWPGIGKPYAAASGRTFGTFHAIALHDQVV
jgi:hypothetical protein